jgi:glycosyltransferase involved in cell wall biosynthesis
MGAKVHMFVLNNFTRDNRVLREAKALVSEGHDVTVFALLDSRTRENETVEGVRVRRMRQSHYYRYPFAVYERFVERPASRIMRCLAPKRRAAAQTASSNGEIARSTSNGAPIGLSAGDEGAVDPLRGLYRHLRGNMIGRLTVLKMDDFYRKCRRSLQKDRADVYHAHDLPMLPIACRAVRQFGGKVVYDSHELFTESGHMSAQMSRHWKGVEDELIHRADAVFTVCESIGEELMQRYGIAMPRILRNCCEQTPIESSRELIRERTGIANDTPIVLYQGGFANGRGLFNLIRATKFIQRAAVVFMGWGNIEDDLRQYARQENLQDRIFFIPPAPQSELLSWSSSADVGVIPYQAVRLNNYYSCPNKLFEYINAGIAVAASAYPELVRVIDGYGVGRTFDPDQPEEVGRTIEGMLQDRARLEEMKNNARSAARELNWQVESQRLISTYRELLQ